MILVQQEEVLQGEKRFDTLTQEHETNNIDHSTVNPELAEHISDYPGQAVESLDFDSKIPE